MPSPFAADAVRASAVEILDQALAILRERCAVDFAGYRRSTMERRLANRMIAARVTTTDGYLALLCDSPEEAHRLAANLTIKVSRFYRNAPMFDLLRDRVLPSLRARFGSALRVWSAGCAGGEEAYTLAMLTEHPAAIIATDVDEAPLAAARSGLYRSEAFAELPEPLLRDFVQRSADPEILSICEPIRARTEFLRHDLASEDAAPRGQPFHLICCRNVLIYFARPLQRRAIQLLARSLVPGGVLCLGEAEWPIDDTMSLTVVDRRTKVFERAAAPEVRP